MLRNLFKKKAPQKDAPVVATHKDMETHALARNRFGKETIMTRVRHWKHIELHPEYFPEIKEAKKPNNPDFKRIKHEYAEMVFSVIQDYYNYVINLSGLSNRPELHKVLKHTLLEFITLFWDMPASNNNHHSFRFGLLIHSLRVACENAELGESFKLFTESGINTEAMIRDKGHIILAHFFVGLFHDTHKIQDYKLTHQTQYRKVEYNPHLGSILNFKLVHPTGLIEGWETLPQNTSHYSIAYMMWLVPPTFFNTIETGELYRHIMDQMRALIDGGIPGDKEDAALGLREDPDQKMYSGLISAIKELLEELHDKDHMYEVSDEWCCVMFKSFMNNVSRRSPVFPNDASVINYMDHQGLIAAPNCDGMPKFSERYNFVVTSGPAKGKRVKKCSIAFIPREFVEEIMMQVAREHDMLPELSKVQIEKNVFSKKSLVKGLMPPLTSDSFCLPPGEIPPVEETQPVENVEQPPVQETVHPKKQKKASEKPSIQPSANEAGTSDYSPDYEQSLPILEEELMAMDSGVPSDEDAPPYNAYIQGSHPLADHEEPQGNLLPHEQHESGISDSEAYLQAALDFPDEDNVDDQERKEEEGSRTDDNSEVLSGPDEIITHNGELLDHKSFLAQIFALVNKVGINNPEKPIALYLTPENGQAKLLLKIPDVFETILGVDNMLTTEDGQAELMKTLIMLSRSEVIAPVKDGLPEILTDVTYFKVDDLEDSNPIVLKRFLGVELIERFKAKRQIRSLRAYIELREVEEVEE